MIAVATRVAKPPEYGADWNKPPWPGLPCILLGNYMGARPDHFPTTEVRIGYDDAAIHMIFRVSDRYVRAVATDHQESVCGDSCVEFFFTPGPDVSGGYFNFEINCGGTILFHFHPGQENGRIEIPKADCDRIVRSHTLPRFVNPEIQEPLTWTVAYTLPLALLQNYAAVSAPQAHALWRVNFYKCADNTSHPHWLTWAPVDYPKPNFHLPGSFGVLRFA